MGTFGCEIAQAISDHHVLNDIHGMEKVVAVFRNRHIQDIIVADGILAHLSQRLDAFLPVDLLSKRLVNQGNLTGGGILEIVRDGDLASEFRLFRQEAFHRIDGPPHDDGRFIDIRKRFGKAQMFVLCGQRLPIRLINRLTGIA